MNLLLAFDPGGRGRGMVEKYQGAAEQYGYIAAGSNNSRNGPWSVSAAAVKAMTADLAPPPARSSVCLHCCSSKRR